MDIKKNIYKIVLGILVIVLLLLCFGKPLGINFTFSFFNILGLFFVLSWLYIFVGLLRFKRWAWGIFLVTLMLIVLTVIISVTLWGLKIDAEELPEALLYMFFWFSLLTISIFCIFTVIRKLIRKYRK